MKKLVLALLVLSPMMSLAQQSVEQNKVICVTDANLKSDTRGVVVQRATNLLNAQITTESWKNRYTKASAPTISIDDKTNETTACVTVTKPAGG